MEDSLLIWAIRHSESDKNRFGRYSSMAGDEQLTELGQKQSLDIASIIRSISGGGLTGITVLHAGNLRAQHTAQTVADSMNSQTKVAPELNPLASPSLAGLTSEQIETSFPALAHQIRLYRKGALSAYKVDWPDEQLRGLERRIDRFIRTFLLGARHSIAVVGHKSSLTCLLITIMKQQGRYPEDHYGYLDVPVGSLSLIRRSTSGLDVLEVGVSVKNLRRLMSKGLI